MLTLFYKDSNDVSINKNEIFRYLRYQPGTAVSETDLLIDECIEEFNSCVEYKACYDRFSIQTTEESTDFGFMQVHSKSLGVNLAGCDEVFTFAATTGVGAERLIKKYIRLSPSRSFILNAIGSAAIESFSDLLNAKLRADIEEEGLFLRPRFSPGYGDFPLTHQTELLRALDTSRKLNLTLTDSLLMIPVKSVSAIIGISRTPNTCRTKSCEQCTNIDCQYRR